MQASSDTLRTVRCYLCGKPFDAPTRAMSLSCPWCYRRVTLDDVVVRDECYTNRVQTCGRVVVLKRGKLRAGLIEASLGVEVYGLIEGKIRSHARLYVAPKGCLRGEAWAPTVQLEPGAVVDGASLKIGPGVMPDWGEVVGSGVVSGAGEGGDGAASAGGRGATRAAPGAGFDGAAAREAGGKLRVVLNLLEGRAAGFSVRSGGRGRR